MQCIGIINPIRSGGNLLNRLLDTHPQLLTNHSENFLSVYITRNDQLEKRISKFKKKIVGKLDKKKFFRSLLFKDKYHIKASKTGWIKTNYNNPIEYRYNYNLHLKYFMESLELNSNYRNLLDAYVKSFFKSFNSRNIRKEIKFYNTYWPNFSLYKKNLKNFFEIYPDGYLIYIIRDPLQWAASCKIRKPKEFSMRYMRLFYERSILNFINLTNYKKQNILIIDFNDLIINTKKTMKAILRKLNLKNKHQGIIHPTVFKKKIEGNSILPEERTFKVNKNVLKNFNTILTNDEKKKIVQKFNKIYRKILKKKLNFN